MAGGGCYKCTKYTVIVFTLFVWLIGVAVLGLGSYILATDYGVTQMSAILGSDLYKAGVYLLIALGAIILVISFSGFSGAFMESRCLLGLYFAVMLILTIFFIVVCIIGFVFRNNIKDGLQRDAETTLMKKYGSDADVTDGWNKLQQELECCGMTGGMNSNTSWAFYKLHTVWFKNQSDSVRRLRYVPTSCCKPDGNMGVCTGSVHNDNQPPKAGPPVTDTMENNTALFTEGCYDKLDDFLEDNAIIIGGASVTSLFIMLLGVVFSVCQWVQIGRQG